LDEPCHAGRRRTMLSEPLACSSTLGRRPFACKSDEQSFSWRSFGARVSVSSSKISKLKPTHHFLRQFHEDNRETFSLKRGLDSF